MGGDPFLRLAVKESLSNFILATQKTARGQAITQKLRILWFYINCTEYPTRHLISMPLQIWLKKVLSFFSEIDILLDELALVNIQSLRKAIRDKKTKDVLELVELRLEILFQDYKKLKLSTTPATTISGFSSPEAPSSPSTQAARSSGFSSTHDTSLLTDSWLSCPVVDEGLIVGRDDDVQKIVENMLLGSRSTFTGDVPVIAIVGMGGIGKTALAQLIYNNETVVKHFSKRFWACVSDDNLEVDLFREDIRAWDLAINKSCDMSTATRRQGKKAQNFLLVLDNMWDEDSRRWGDMQTFLRRIRGVKGSLVLITTRSLQASAIMRPFFSYHLPLLREEYSWDLFQKEAFADIGREITPKLETTIRKLVKEIGGLPLAIRVLARQLCSTSSIDQHNLLDVYEQSKEYGILPSLRLSFDRLPSTPIKLCFLFCARLPKGSRIYKDELIQLWMSQGYLIPSVVERNLTMEDTGESYFQSLLQNSLMQNIEKDEYGTIVSCLMHDLVHDLANYISNRCDLNLKCDASKMGDAYRVRHLSFSLLEWKNPEPSIGSFSELPYELSNSNALGSQISIFTHLYSLSLADTVIHELPSTVSSLKHLRYLDISRTRIKRVPTSVTLLKNLQTFRILHCLFLEQFPSNFHLLLNLRHFYMDDDENGRHLLPTGLGCLSSLQTLPFFVVDPEKKRKMEELGQLSNLKGELNIYGLEHVKGEKEASMAKLANNSKIHGLKFHWTTGRAFMGLSNDESVLKGLEPHLNLRRLTIENYRGLKLAPWMSIRKASLPLCNLVELKLKNCRRIMQIPTLGHIPSLRVLFMEGMHSLIYIGSAFYGTKKADGTSICRTIGAVFPALRELTLSDMPKLVEWLSPDYYFQTTNMFPQLEKLVIEGCPLLRTVPSDFLAVKSLIIENIDSDVLGKITMQLTTLEYVSLDIVSGKNIDPNLETLLRNNCRVKQLRVQRCDDLYRLPGVLWDLPTLESLNIWDCPNLDYIPDIEEPQTLSSLVVFSISGCHSLKTLPIGLDNMKHLETFSISGCHQLKCVASVDMCGLTSLQKLEISDSGLLTSSGYWLQWLLSLTGLKDLTIGGFSRDLDYFPFPEGFHSLQKLTLEGWQNLKSLPIELRNFTALVELRIFGFEGLVVLREWLRNLSSLEYMQLWHCKNLERFPSKESMKCLTKLRYLDIGGCPLLEERCEKGIGPEWEKISHIPSIRIGNYYIQCS